VQQEPKKYNYFYLLGAAERLLGDQPFQAKVYPGAFWHYGKSCRFMALYNSIEFQHALRFLFDRLLEMDNQAERATILATLNAYWRDQRLVGRFPEFTRTCDEVSRLI